METAWTVDEHGQWVAVDPQEETQLRDAVEVAMFLREAEALARTMPEQPMAEEG